MTSRDWHGDQRAVFDRDGHTCRRCGATDSTGDESASTADLHCYPIGDVPLEGTVHESSLVTVCDRCFDSLQGASVATDTQPDDETLFTLARDLTQRQGVTVSAVASFSSIATSLPTALEDAGEDDAARTDAEAEYRQARREVLLAIESVPSRLDPLAAVDETALDPAVSDPLAELVEAARTLQTELRELVSYCETVPVAIGRCRGCLKATETSETDKRDDTAACPTCGLPSESAGTAVMGTDDSMEARLSAINETLQGASATTETLTECAGQVATALQGEPTDPQ
ncbi:HNH endonuclease [Natronolimnobius sp. AArcel1]|uniref:HNH endonuclease n=1 Tax=Natronolimnobius sp. AArcel1 TaxID=1679093 RepID=UPI0013EDAF10|nr:HNH endonuclease [Natronolimnobius sp. AArcel1]